jgi:hypothetical protein
LLVTFANVPDWSAGSRLQNGTRRPLNRPTHTIEIAYGHAPVLTPVRRLVLAFAVLISVTAGADGVTFVSPLDGAQALGPMLLEVRTDVERIDRVEFSVDGALAGVVRAAPWRFYFDFGTSLAPRTVTATVWSDGFATSHAATVRTAGITANERLDVDLVEVPMRIRTGRTPGPSDFRLRENGVEQVVRDVKLERPPAHFAFVVDRSLSMGNGKLEAALSAIQSELPQLRQGDTASLVLFDHNVSAAEPIAAGIDLVGRHASTPSGGTSLRDALASIASPDRTYALVITDGGDRNSTLDEEKALQRISGTRTVVNAIVLGSSHARFLDRAAANTGGSVVQASKERLRSELARMLQDINGRCLLVYQSSGTKRGWRSIDIDARKRGIEIVSARKGYFAQP